MVKPASYCLEESKYIEGLHGLRAIACLAVFFVHFGQFSKFDMQWMLFDITLLIKNSTTGVALFFLLSGFLLSQPFWRNKEQNKNNIWQYWIKRLGRIIPAYYVCLTGLIILQKQWTHSNSTNDIILHYLFLHNFSEKSIFNINPPFWTLAVEMQFYLLLPLFFYFTRWIKSSLTCIIFFVLGVCFYFLNFSIMEMTSNIVRLPGNSGLFSLHGAVIEKSILAHMPHFMLGIAAGWVYIKKKSAQTANTLKNDLTVLLCFFVVLIILSTPLDNLFTVPFGRYNYPYVPGLLAVIILKVPFTKVIKKLLESTPIRFIGIISYGIYIYHLPIQRFTEIIMSRLGLSNEIHWFVFGISSLFITILVSSFSYYIIETFFIERSKKYAAI